MTTAELAKGILAAEEIARLHDPEYRKSLLPEHLRPACIYYDDDTAEPPGQRTGPDGVATDCQSKWLRTCEIHGQCARTKLAARPGVKCCEGCPDRVAPTEADQP